MSLEIYVLLVLLISVSLNIYLIWRTTKAHKATKALGLEKVIQHQLYRTACHCHETVELYYPEGRDRAKKPKDMLGYIVYRVEREFEKEAKIARAIGYHCSLDWRDTFQQLRPTPRELGGCSDPTHQQP